MVFQRQSSRRARPFCDAYGGHQFVSFGGPAPDLAISPDGKTMVYVTGNGANDSLAMGRTLDQAEFTPIAGAQPASSPFFSPDGRWLGFASPGFVKKTLVGGGMLTPTVVSRVAGTGIVGATWTTDGSIIFATNDQATGLLEVSDQGASLGY
jgi:serine/threonine-protein kinase